MSSWRPTAWGINLPAVWSGPPSGRSSSSASAGPGRPLVEDFQRVKQVLREIGDLEEPLRQFPLLDQRARAPAAAID